MGATMGIAPADKGLSPRVAAASIAALGAWCALGWVHFYRFCFPWADTWCGVGAAAPGGTPLHLHAALLGNFQNADSAWGFHAPFPPLVTSLVFAVLPFSPGRAIGLFLLLWVGVALATAWAVHRATGSRFWSACAAALVLADRCMFSVGAADRPEFLACLGILLAVFAAGEPSHRFARASAAVGAFLMTACHPATLLAAALFVVAEAARGLWRRPGVLIALSCGGLAGAALDASWFAFQPDAWAQFRDHAVHASVPYTFGRTLWLSLQEHYASTGTGHALWLAAVIAAVACLRRAAPLAAASGSMLLVLLVAEQKFANVNYLCLGLPVAAVVLASVLPARPSRAARLAACLLVGLHGLFWVSRTHKFVADGCPDVRAELAQITRSLPGSGRVLIPEVLWEDAIGDPSRYALNTLPYHSTTARRLDYEAFVYGRLRPGDVVVVDRFQLHPPAHRAHGGRVVARGRAPPRDCGQERLGL